MRLELTAKRDPASSGKTTGAELNCETIAGEYSGLTVRLKGTNESYLQEQYSNRLGYGPDRGGHSPVATQYDGTLFLYDFEVINFFETLVAGSKKSPDFKRLCAAVVKELRRVRP